MFKSNKQKAMSEKTEPSKHIKKLTGIACDNYVNGFFADFKSDLCENCAERKSKHKIVSPTGGKRD